IGSGKPGPALPVPLPVHSFAFSADNQMLLVCSTNRVKIVDARTGKPWRGTGERDAVPGAAWHRNNDYVVVSPDRMCWTMQSNGTGSGNRVQESGLRRLVFAPENDLAVVLGSDSVGFYRIPSRGGVFPR